MWGCGHCPGPGGMQGSGSPGACRGPWAELSIRCRIKITSNPRHRLRKGKGILRLAQTVSHTAAEEEISKAATVKY